MNGTTRIATGSPTIVDSIGPYPCRTTSHACCIHAGPTRRRRSPDATDGTGRRSHPRERPCSRSSRAPMNATGRHSAHPIARHTAAMFHTACVSVACVDIDRESPETYTPTNATPYNAWRQTQRTDRRRANAAACARSTSENVPIFSGSSGASDIRGTAYPGRRPVSGHLERALREPEEEALDLRLRLGLRVARRPKRHEQRREVLDRRVRVRHPGRLAEVHQPIDRTVVERLRGPQVELAGPSGRLCVGPPVTQERQPVRHEAGAHDQHAFVAKGPQSLADRKQVLRVEVRH